MDNSKTDGDIELSHNARMALSCWREVQDRKSTSHYNRHTQYNQRKTDEVRDAFKTYLYGCSYNEQMAILDLIERETRLRKMGYF